MLFIALRTVDVCFTLLPALGVSNSSRPAVSCNSSLVKPCRAISEYCQGAANTSRKVIQKF